MPLVYLLSIVTTLDCLFLAHYLYKIMCCFCFCSMVWFSSHLSVVNLKYSGSLWIFRAAQHFVGGCCFKRQLCCLLHLSQPIALVVVFDATSEEAPQLPSLCSHTPRICLLAGFTRCRDPAKVAIPEQVLTVEWVKWSYSCRPGCHHASAAEWVLNGS